MTVVGTPKNHEKGAMDNELRQQEQISAPVEHKGSEQPNINASELVALCRELEVSTLPSKSRLLELIKKGFEGDKGISLSYSGRREPWQIARMVKPKVTKTLKEVSVGADEAEWGGNLLVEGENLSAMVSLYKYRGQVDLIVTDPPYNADRDFRYNDKWDTNPDDPGLGDIVLPDDGSKHSKWLRFMAPRLYMMKEMLRPHGVIAICIDHRELYRLGILMDEIFGEKNRIGIINWQKSYSPKSDSKHISTATEYVLVYAKDITRAKTGLEVRTEAMNARYKNPDNDPDGGWKSADPAAKDFSNTGTFGIQSPFTGEIYYPASSKERSHWNAAKETVKSWLEGWGVEYEEKDIGDGIQCISRAGKILPAKALVIKGCQFCDGRVEGSENVLKSARESAKAILKRGQWPRVYFGITGETGPQLKRHLESVKKGKVSLTWWADDEYEQPFSIECTSWGHKESGHSQTGINELDAVVGDNHGFETVKPLKLIKKIVQLWCRPDGLVLDPFAGSGTTGQAILELNKEAGASRRFILVEQGNTEKGDLYAKTLTAERLRRTITGEWAIGRREPVPGGFRYVQVQRRKVDPKAVVALAREEMIDVLTTSYWNSSERSKSSLLRVESDGYLFAKNSRGEGFFLVWQPEGVASLTRDIYSVIAKEAKSLGLAGRFHIYAAAAPYVAQNVEFYKIPDKVLEHLGFDSSLDGGDTDGEEE
jgi:adenine-specific DNA-methyltransferase